MKSLKEQEASGELNGSAGNNRRILIQYRALILGIFALPFLSLIFGLTADTFFPGLAGSKIIVALPLLAGPLFFLLFYSCLLKDNRHLREAALRWTSRAYRNNVTKLDEREKLIMDQAFRTSYRLLTGAFIVTVAVLNYLVIDWQLSYHLGSNGFYEILWGAIILSRFLPAAVVAWYERV